MNCLDYLIGTMVHNVPFHQSVELIDQLLEERIDYSNCKALTELFNAVSPSTITTEYNSITENNFSTTNTFQISHDLESTNANKRKFTSFSTEQEITATFEFTKKRKQYQLNPNVKVLLQDKYNALNNYKTTSMDDSINATNLVCKYRAKESLQQFYSSIKKNPFNYHSYFQLLEVFRLLDKNNETMKWLKIAIRRCEEELNILNEISEKVKEKEEWNKIFKLLVTKTTAIQLVFKGCLHHFNQLSNPNEYFYSAIDIDDNCFYGFYFIGMLTGFQKLYQRDYTNNSIDYLEKALKSSCNRELCFGFRGDLNNNLIDINYGNDMLTPFIHYMIGLLQWRNGETTKALDQFEMALQYQPELILIYLNRITLYQQTKRYDKALQDNEKLLKIVINYPKELRTEISICYLNRALLLLEIKERNTIGHVLDCLELAFQYCNVNICALDWLCGIQISRGQISLEKYTSYASKVLENLGNLERDDVIRFCKLQIHMYRLFKVEKQVAHWTKQLQFYNNANSRVQ